MPRTIPRLLRVIHHVRAGCVTASAGRNRVSLPHRGRDTRFRLSIWLRIQLERGDGGSFEFMSWMPIMMAVLGLIAMATLVRSAQPPLWAAARECARVASASLDSGKGVGKGRAVASESLRGNGIAHERALISVTHDGARGGLATCTIRYPVALGALPMSAWIGRDSLELSSSFTSVIEPYQGE
jgi:hypothetical protein